VPFNRAGADEESHADLRVGKSVAGHQGDLPLLSSEFIASLDGALAHLLAGRYELIAGALGEGLHADRREHFMGCA
jgi:hypothetical protein